MTALLRRLSLLLALLLIALPATAQTVASTAPIGQWTTIDDETDEARSLVTIYEEGGALFGRVDSVYLRPGEPENPTCEKCEGELKDQPVLGMLIMWDMEPDGDEWSGGRLLDPEKGKIYRGKIWIEDGTLKVRGYLGPFYRTQTWLPKE